MASYEKKLAAQRTAWAKARTNEIARKNQHVIKAGANLPSQWGKVVDNEQRLIDNGHYMKTSEGASLDHYRELLKDEKNRLARGLSREDYANKKRLGTLESVADIKNIKGKNR